jgi:hypothetical protein
LKIPNQKRPPSIWIVAVTSKHEDNKDLLLSFDSKAKAWEWFDAISWTIYLVNNRYINLIHVREGAHPPASASLNSSMTSASPSSLQRDLECWYLRQSFQFEEEFQFLSSGCRFKISTQTMRKKTESGGELGEVEGECCCYLQGHQESLSLHWCYLYLDRERGAGAGGGTGEREVYQRSGLKTIPLSEIDDVLIGGYKTDEGSEDTETRPEQPQVLSIRTKFQTIEFIYPPASDRESTARVERWIQSLISIIHFLAIPVRSSVSVSLSLSLSLSLCLSLYLSLCLTLSLPACLSLALSLSLPLSHSLSPGAPLNLLKVFSSK